MVKVYFKSKRAMNAFVKEKGLVNVNLPKEKTQVSLDWEWQMVYVLRVDESNLPAE